MKQEDRQPESWTELRGLWPEVLFVGGLYGLLLPTFALLRLVLLWRNATLAAQVPAGLLLKSFWVGARFDLAISSYLLLPLLLLLLLVRNRRLVVIGTTVLIGVVLLVGVAEILFYQVSGSRFNDLLFEYLGHPQIVVGRMRDGFPLAGYLAFWLLLFAVSAAAVHWLYRRLLLPQHTATSVRQSLLRIMGTVLALTLMVFFSRGGFGHAPLRWGDAFFSEAPFANHLALNGMFSLGRSAWENICSKPTVWTRTLPPGEALKITRTMLRLPGDTPLSTTDYPLLRRPRPVGASSYRHPPNVVVILLEGFSARFVGALGAQQGLTPEFDRLADHGVLFERAFANGTHAHQGVYASLTSFPNLPGYEYLMEMMEANQDFSGLPAILARHRYQSLFLYNGLFSRDNKEGFFRRHGIERFIGTHEYRNPAFVDPVSGVSDQEVFDRADAEFRLMAGQGPFLGVILTLSNHAPYRLPQPLPFAPVAARAGMSDRLNGIRYTDWALGEFFRRVCREAYFENTLFVIVGVHGVASAPPITSMQLDRFHVPLLFYAPGLLGKQGQRRQAVASQVDIVPSVLDLLGISDPYQCWGRDLFALAPGDPGFAVIKPADGEERVALIEGNRVLIKTARSKPELSLYDLGHPPVASANLYVQQQELARAMEKRLQAYVETGILTLRARHVGLPAAF